MTPPQPPSNRHWQIGVRTSGVVDAFLRSPLSGIAPWVLLSLCSGPGRFEAAASAALGLALLVSWAGRRRGIAVHPLDVFGVCFFAVLAGIGAFASTGTIQTMELWAGELANVALASFAAVTLLIRRPFTVAYAREATSPDVWASPEFLRVNYAITAVWAGTFFFSAAVGGYGDAVLRDPDDFWTGWILQIAATLFAITFTDVYPDHVASEATVAHRSFVVRLLDWLPSFTLVTGVAGLITDSVSTLLGGVLIGLGVVGDVALRRTVRRGS